MTTTDEPADDESRVWEDEILAFEIDDLRAFPPPRPIVFTGSSSIRMWTSLRRDMAPLPVLNRGFGGATLGAVIEFAPRIVLGYAPRAVVLYGGENDLEAYRQATPQRVLALVASFADLLAGACPDARLYLLSLKPSPARRGDWPAVRRFNELLRDFADGDARRVWVDIATASFDERGQVRRELFLDDGLHLSARGYELWTSILRPLLLADVSDPAPA